MCDPVVYTIYIYHVHLHTLYTVFILREACAQIEAQGNYLLEKFTIIMQSGPKLPCSETMKCNELQKTITIILPNSYNATLLLRIGYT